MVGSIQWTSLLFLTTVVLAQETPVLRVNTRLVEVDVVVHSKGEAVADLKQDDFTVLDKGKPQKIASFNVVSFRNNAGKSVPLPPGLVSNRINTVNQEPAGVTVVLYDTLNTVPEDQGYGRQALVRYLDTIQRGDHFALYSLNKTLSVIQDFTDDPERIRQAARRASPEASVDQTADDLASELLADAPDLGDAIANAMYRSSVKEMQDRAQANRAEITGKTLELIARHLQGLPGRKKLIWLTSSFAAQTTDIRSHNGQDTIEHKEFGKEIQKAVRALNDANVAVYPIDPKPISFFNDPGFLRPGIDAMNLFAGGTGGRAFYALNDVASAIKTAAEDSEVTYALGFYPVDIKLDGSYHPLSVKVARKGVDLRARKGYYATDLKPPTEKQTLETLRDIFATPLEATGIGMAARLDPYARQAGVQQLTMTFNLQEVHLEKEQNNWVALIHLATYFPSAQKPNGTEESIKITLTERRLKESLASGYTIQRLVIVGNRKGDLRLAVQDRVTGAAGSVKLALAAAVPANNPTNGQ
ncbi:MAG TPA: VWA domain-containing protein [Bryobacteraceae bacterium]|nr:VWA domain-containing protein [Bryobacteraceae bacterium]